MVAKLGYCRKEHRPPHHSVVHHTIVYAHTPTPFRKSRAFMGINRSTTPGSGADTNKRNLPQCENSMATTTTKKTRKPEAEAQRSPQKRLQILYCLVSTRICFLRRLQRSLIRVATKHAAMRHWPGLKPTPPIGVAIVPEKTGETNVDTCMSMQQVYTYACDVRLSSYYV